MRQDSLPLQGPLRRWW
jgi:hypothetical protein